MCLEVDTLNEMGAIEECSAGELRGPTLTGTLRPLGSQWAAETKAGA